MQNSGESYGQTLPDQVDRIASLFDVHLGLLVDVRELYRDRAALEREYAAKLQVLARKATDKKNKIASLLVVGDSPTKAYDEATLRQSLKSSTLDNAYNEIISSVSNASQDHINLAEAITAHVTESLKTVERQNEEGKKKQMQFYQKLVAERDKSNSERNKTKQKYDNDCMEVESHRQKQGHAQNDRHADRAARQYEQQRVDMLSSKNVYLISTAVANRMKAKFYTEDLPGLEDTFQDLQTRLVTKFVGILLQAQTIQVMHHDTLKDRFASVESALKAIDVGKDQDLFVDHNIRPFTVPNDLPFEPCSSHYDTADMNVEPAPKIFLQNKLARSRNKLQELDPVLQAKRDEVEKYGNFAAGYPSGDDSVNNDEVLSNYLEAKQQLVFYSNSACILNTEIETISAALGDDEGGQSPHAFKSSSFSIPTTCGYCKASVWGLSKQGKTCKACGLSVHSKCELKVPAECSGIPGQYRTSELVSRTSSTVSKTNSKRSSGQSLDDVTPTPSSFVQPSHISQVDDSFSLARVIFDFSASSPFELSVSEGISVRILEEDDGSGWIKVADEYGGKGLVPASYIEAVESRGPEKSPPQQGSGEKVRALYTYEAQGADEVTIREGEVVELSAGPNGGQHYADGWWEGINTSGQKGIFPSNYVEFF